MEISDYFFSHYLTTSQMICNASFLLVLAAIIIRTIVLIRRVNKSPADTTRKEVIMPMALLALKTSLLALIPVMVYWCIAIRYAFLAVGRDGDPALVGQFFGYLLVPPVSGLLIITIGVLQYYIIDFITSTERFIICNDQK